MKAVAVLLLAMVAASQAAPFTYLTHPLTYGHVATPVVYGAPKVTNVEIKTPVITKANLNVLTDEDKISTTEIKPFVGYGYAPYRYLV